METLKLLVRSCLVFHPRQICMTSPTQIPASPDTVTTRQLVGSFTAKHWVAVITFLLMVVTAIGSSAFWMGQHFAEADLKVASARVNQLLENYASLQSKHQATLDELKRKQKEINSLSFALGKASNCTFIHEQIRALNIQIQSTSGWGNDQSERSSMLQQRLTAYQQQLSNCNK